jgi:diguanylate cyclase (GGDEF)-like protein
MMTATGVPIEIEAPPSVWPSAVVAVDADGLVTAARVSAAWSAFEARGLVGQPLAAMLSPESAAAWATVHWPALGRDRRADAMPLELRAGRDGTLVTAIASWRPRAEGGWQGLLVPAEGTAGADPAFARARLTVSEVPAALLQIAVGESGRLVLRYASERLPELLGLPPGPVPADGDHLLAALEPGSRRLLIQRLMMAGSGAAGEWSVVLVPLARPHAQLELSVRRGSGDSAWHGVITDVSQRDAMARQLRRQAETDTLTQLANRKALMTHLEARTILGESFALLYMDCDRFKQVNDSLGHGAGDELLLAVAERLRSVLRPSDGVLVPTEPVGMLAARLGGDEFVVVLDGVSDGEVAAGIADRILRTLSRPYRLQGHQMVVTVSIGMVVAGEGSEPEALLRDADTAMYEAKRRGRGRCVLFEPSMGRRVLEAMALESDLRHALDTGQLRVVYQPIVDIRSGRVVGVEALARWRHPQRGEVSPAEFIPVAEESGLISMVGETVLRMACSQWQDWRRRGLPVPARLSVNLSRAQLGDRQLPQRIAQVLAEVGMPVDSLQLEVTESLAGEQASMRDALLAVRDTGVRLALDDFGTGHSSLASLHELPVGTVKLDRAFTRGVESGLYQRALIHAAVQLAQALRLEVVAEGVETVGQARALVELGCCLAQGWLYARPLEADAVAQMLLSPALRVLDEVAEPAPGG